MGERIVNILFLGGAKRVSLAEHLISAGKSLGLEVKVFSYELIDKVPLASVGTIIIGKKWKDETVIEDLIQVVRNHSINIILPFVDPAIELASILKALLPDVFIPSCDREICAIMFDKIKSEQWFKQNSISIPTSYKLGDDLNFPVIIKPRRGSASQGIKVINNMKEWQEVDNPKDFVIQEYIANREEYTIDCYINQSGQIISVVPRIRLVIAGGEVMNSKTLKDDTLINESTKILKTGGFFGVTIQFIRNKDNGKTYVMEINPRLGGGVITSIEAGADIPTYILKEYMGESLTPCSNWKPDTLMTRYFKEVIFYADHH